MRNRVVCRDDATARLMPGPLPDTRQAIQRALAATRDDRVDTSWSDAGVIVGDPDWAGGPHHRGPRPTASSDRPTTG